MPPTPKIEKIQKYFKHVKINIFKKMAFYKVSDKTDIRFEFSVKNCVFQHWSTFILYIFWKMSNLETYNLKNSLKCSVSGLGSIKKRFLMVESCLEHISKLILIGKSNANYLKHWKPKNIIFSKLAGNHLKRCALMRWSFSILNDNTKCLVWWVNNRNTEA